MKGRKLFYLIASLVLPVAVFLFLKFFGRNEFSVPPLFQSEAELPDSLCRYRYDWPYAIPDSVRASLPFDARIELVVVTFLPAEGNAGGGDRLVRRAEAMFGDDPVAFKRMGDAGPDSDTLRRCVFLLSGKATVALVDSVGRIRGQYDAGSLEDIDRMTVELKIILGKY